MYDPKAGSRHKWVSHAVIEQYILLHEGIQELLYPLPSLNYPHSIFATVYRHGTCHSFLNNCE